MQQLNRLPIKKKSLLCLALGIVCLALWINSAPAAEGAKPCADDTAKFCKDVKPGGGGLSKCLKEHENELSPECKASITESRKKAKEGREDCTVDIGKFCKNVQQGKGRIMKCLKEHQAELSPECKQGMSKTKKQ